MRIAFSVLIAALIAATCTPAAHAQHLWWNTEKQHDATCLYGEITVLATNSGIYYCGANWHPGEPAGGYCGIQHNSPQRRCTIFSIWDTTAELHPKITEADAKTHLSRFGGEGTGAHTDLDWNWQLGEMFQFFVRKEPGAAADTTDTRYYIFDRGPQKWRHVATISNPNGGKKSVATIGGGLNSFLENFTGQDRKAAKLATYRLWLGPSVEKLQCLTRAEGDGEWGRLHDAYFLAAGDKAELDKVFTEVRKDYGEPDYGGHGKKPEPISDKRLPEKLVQELKSLPRAEKLP
jgi:hypothetical protein